MNDEFRENSMQSPEMQAYISEATKDNQDEMLEKARQKVLEAMANEYEFAPSAAEGGTGTAFFCLRKATLDWHVLKTARPGFDKQFPQEARLALSLGKHPNVIYTHTILKKNNKYYIVMEYVGPRPSSISDKVEGDTLENVLRKGVDHRFAILWAIDLCHGMEYLYKNGIQVHNDITPKNLFIAQNNVLKVGDFGLANQRGGTKYYRAPKWLSGERRDIWSAGIVFYEMLNGLKNPAYPTIYGKEHLHNEDHEYSHLDWDAINKSPYSDILTKCLTKNKKHYEHFSDFRKDLENEFIKLGCNLRARDYGLPPLTAYECVNKGVGWDNLQEYQQAIKYYNKAIELYLKNNDKKAVWRVLVFFPRFWERANAPVQPVLDLLGRFIKENPQDAWGYEQRAEAYLLLIRYDEAIADYTKAIELAPQNSNYYSKRGDAYYYLNEYKKAVEDYTQALKLSVEYQMGYLSLSLQFPQAWKKANTPVQPVLDLLSRFIKQHPKDVKGYETRGRAYDRLKCYKEAVANYTKAIKRSPENAGLYNRRGELYALLADYKKAISDFETNIALCIKKKEPYWTIPFQFPQIWGEAKAPIRPVLKLLGSAIKQNPKDAKVYERRSKAYCRLRRYGKAIGDLTKAIELAPYNSNYYKQRGDAHYYLNEYKEAVEDYTQTLKLSIENQKGYLSFISLRFPEVWGKAGVSVEPMLELLGRAIEQNPKNSRGYEQRADACFRLKCYKEAIGDLTKAIELAPQNLNYYSKRGEAHYYLNEYKKAVEDYTQTLKLSIDNQSSNWSIPSHFPEAWEKAEIPVEPMLELLDCAIAQNPKSTRGYEQRASAYYCLKRYDEAIADYTKAIKLDPQNSNYYSKRGENYYYLNEYKKAVEDYTQSFKMSIDSHSYWSIPVNFPGLWEKAGVSVEAMLELLRHAIAQNPKSTRGYEQRAEAYCRLKRYKEAIADYTKAIKLSPKNARAYNLRGNVFDKMEYYDEAIADYTKAIELSPKSLIYYTKRGDSFSKIGCHDKAIMDYTKAIKLSSKSERSPIFDMNFIFRPKSTVYYYTKRGDSFRRIGCYDKAIADYTKVIELEPEAAGAYNKRGDVFHEMGHYDKAIADYTKAIELEEKFERSNKLARDLSSIFGSQLLTYYTKRGDSFRRIGGYDKAVADYTKVIELEPETAGAYNKRGDVFHETGHYDKAIADYTKAIELSSKFVRDISSIFGPQLLIYYTNRGNSWRMLERYDEALVDYIKAIELDKKNELALQGLLQLYRKMKEPKKAAQIQKQLDKLQEKPKKNTGKRKKDSK